jgi:hypothetical protein
METKERRSGQLPGEHLQRDRRESGRDREQHQPSQQAPLHRDFFHMHSVRASRTGLIGDFTVSLERFWAPRGLGDTSGEACGHRQIAQVCAGLSS